MKKSTKTEIKFEGIARHGGEDERKEEDNYMRETEGSCDAGCEMRDGVVTRYAKHDAFRCKDLWTYCLNVRGSVFGMFEEKRSLF